MFSCFLQNSNIFRLSQVSGRTAMKIGELLAGNDVISKVNSTSVFATILSHDIDLSITC